MNSPVFYSPENILSVVLPAVGDMDNKAFAKGFYMSVIQKGIEELAIDSFFDERRETIDFPVDDLTASLPAGCFNVRNVYLLNGTDCNIQDSIKVYWKRNYFTKGIGYVANDKGANRNDPFAVHRGPWGIGTDGPRNAFDKSFIRADTRATVNQTYFYNIQGGSIMFSSSCRGKTNKVMIHYNGIGGNIEDAPIIPLFARTAIEDYTIEYVLRMRMANEADRKWSSLWQVYEKRLNKDAQYGMGGSWLTAQYRVKNLNSSQRTELAEYLSSPAKGSGY